MPFTYYYSDAIGGCVVYIEHTPATNQTDYTDFLVKAIVNGHVEMAIAIIENSSDLININYCTMYKQLWVNLVELAIYMDVPLQKRLDIIKTIIKSDKFVLKTTENQKLDVLSFIMENFKSDHDLIEQLLSINNIENKWIFNADAVIQPIVKAILINMPPKIINKIGSLMIKSTNSMKNIYFHQIKNILGEKKLNDILAGKYTLEKESNDLKESDNLKDQYSTLKNENDLLNKENEKLKNLLDNTNKKELEIMEENERLKNLLDNTNKKELEIMEENERLKNTLNNMEKIDLLACDYFIKKNKDLMSDNDLMIIYQFLHNSKNDKWQYIKDLTIDKYMSIITEKLQESSLESTQQFDELKSLKEKYLELENEYKILKSTKDLELEKRDQRLENLLENIERYRKILDNLANIDLEACSIFYAENKEYIAKKDLLTIYTFLWNSKNYKWGYIEDLTLNKLLDLIKETIPEITEPSIEQIKDINISVDNNVNVNDKEPMDSPIIEPIDSPIMAPENSDSSDNEEGFIVVKQ
jgi:hypothetical protein